MTECTQSFELSSQQLRPGVDVCRRRHSHSSGEECSLYDSISGQGAHPCVCVTVEAPWSGK